MGWNGEYADPDTGMVWLRARWYDPASARFITADPWHGDPSVPASLNRYLYANADPVNNTDPTGLSTMIEQQASMQLRLEINSISAGYYLGLLSTLRTATALLATTAGVLAAGGAAYWAVAGHAGDPNDQDGIDGPRPEPQPQPQGPRGPNSPPPTAVDTCQIPPGSEPETLYHYTRWDTVSYVERDGVRAVLGAGKIWLSPTLYTSAGAAQTNLALPDPPPDGYYEVPRERLEDIYGPYCVDPLFGQPGGGIEYWTTRPINMEGLTFHPFP
ncbi:RHS repeat-associated core domain-containing protein [Demequina activiva]|uniref:RHS repeat-associated core domain-containing protein n=1 Tax=Demequina activiva TaxID=1582364 RepID=A0A919Q698_9MICO|nr:RHS repeat-associated core domain-containing protein [Demequina activiva]GIG55008.1 hypothetical protein Dac01nite_17600 [Demequina activiva]